VDVSVPWSFANNPSDHNLLFIQRTSQDVTDVRKRVTRRRPGVTDFASKYESESSVAITPGTNLLISKPRAFMANNKLKGDPTGQAKFIGTLFGTGVIALLTTHSRRPLIFATEPPAATLRGGATG
jgi:hypothetical protein